MSYQVLARKWRPQRFDDVVGQERHMRTLRNVITSGRISHAYVFAGARGCGKTTTARILARALSCAKGPTPDPCGECDACLEIAHGRDIDVLEIDAASHTGIDNIREVVIANLAFSPVRNRYKVFIIDEVHQLSTASFNALLKSIEEPPEHVVFMMATTELHKIPDTILSRAQVFEFRAIPSKAIAEQLRKIAAAEKIEVSSDALALMARAAEGSMRDAQSSFDQVIAYAGQTITVDDVSTVLGLVGRDVLFDVIEAVTDEDGPRAFALADRAVESGHDLRLVCRELSGVVRDLMIVSVDPARAGEAEVAEGERTRLTQLAARFSREDLMRAFDILTKAEQDIRVASQPRYHFEMALLRWMHLRKLVPLTELVEQLGGGSPPVTRAIAASPRQAAGSSSSRIVAPREPASTPARVAPPATPGTAAPPPPRSQVSAQTSLETPAVPAPALKDRLLAEIRGAKGFFYNTVVAQAQKIEVTDDRVTFTFLPVQRALWDQCQQAGPWLTEMAERLAGRRMTVTAVQAAAPQAAPVSEPASESRAEAAPNDGNARDAKSEAMSSPAVQALLDVFPAQIRDVEEM
jgi:DNA polymerase-3 subunit gamma/tau